MTRRRVRNLSLFAFLTLFIILSAGTLWLARDRAMLLVHPRRTEPARTPDDYLFLDWETVSFTTSDGLRLHGWFIPPAPDTDGTTLIFVHGFGGNRGGLLAQAALTADYGYGALLFDLRNHGESEGRVTTLGYQEPLDVQAAYDYLLTRPEVNADRVALVGESLGGATVIRAAANMPQIRAVIAQAAYSSLEDNIAEGVRRIAGLPPFPFAPLVILFGEQEAGADIGAVRPVDDIARIAPRPVLLLHGRQDELIDVSNSQRLYDAAGEPKTLYIFEDAQHGGLLFADEAAFEDQVIAFLDTHLPNFSATAASAG